jgi:hypothetical protein
MFSNVAMDKKTRWTIFGDESVIEATKNLADGYGDVGVTALSAFALWMSQSEQVRREVAQRYEIARIKSKTGGSVLEEFNRLQEQAEAERAEDLRRRVAQELAEGRAPGAAPGQPPRRSNRRSA